MAVPGRLRAEGRDRKIMWRGSQGAASAERHVILPDLQNEPIVFHKKLGEGGFSTVYRCAIGPLTYNSTHVASTRPLLLPNSRVCGGVQVRGQGVQANGRPDWEGTCARVHDPDPPLPQKHSRLPRVPLSFLSHILFI